MRTRRAVLMLRSAAFAAFAALAGGCTLLDGGGEERPLSSTDVIRVNPSNGVWDAEYGKTDDPSDCSYEFTVSRLENGIAVDVRVRDTKLVTDSCERWDAEGRPWDDDAVICCFDGDLDRSKDSRAMTGLVYGGEYVLSANNSSHDGFSSCPGGYGSEWWGSVSTDVPDETRYSLFFSWKCLGLPRPPRDFENVAFGFNICVVDDDTGGRADRALYWMGNPTMPYRDESGFGTINLEGRR